MITLKKISHLTGFSVSTVSKALNNKQDINVETKKRIQEFAYQRNYVPNKNAISLRKSKSFIIAVILPQVNDAFYSETLCNIQKMASKSGYRIMFFQSFESTAKEVVYLDEINDGSVDGAIVLSTNRNEFKANYNKINTIPIESVQITKSQNLDVLKADCMAIFGNLLNQIN
ncbi:LacI family DNA-binding transcriptional regulator [Flavobacterium sp. PLA-1-15]|uniref:LacI family DNA-binding transcriptional regulator n=1 Tax=Flavobacterium sp. PLA-1-15 TaxID=3380533 RepID=UPI003B77B034